MDTQSRWCTLLRRASRGGVLALAMTGATLAMAESPREAVERALQVFADGDVVQAMQILQPVAEAGDPLAQVRLAYIFDQSRLYEPALRWYREAAEAGNTEAAVGLATLIVAGEGTAADPVEAGRWMRRAAEADHARANLAMAAAYERGGLGLEVDPADALEWYRRAAELGSREARQRLARAYADGELGLAPDPQAAARWAESAGANQ
ncbi:sel1 repeat family protein [Halomonas sp. DQ26W]|uniref:tetratricopeptide repeat protein n=1 Tax=Halomonas sp. DQ26W TaxID=2282311 RepID=UPI000DF73294|nr:tetratricopeptide repeat protein [Halomonas sp. DQ26W]RDB42434.1 sel1 repeat family protein [Halomonas sp. DQ26W]